MFAENGGLRQWIVSCRASKDLVLSNQKGKMPGSRKNPPMLHDDPSSRIPPPKRSPSFVARAENARSAEGYRMRLARPDASEPRVRRRRKPVVRIQKEWIISGLLGFLVIAAVFGFWLAGVMRTKALPAAPPVVSRQVLEAPPEKWQGPIPPEVADRFIAATTHEERLKWVRNPDLVGADMADFFSSGPGASEKVKSIVPLPIAAAGPLVFEEFLAQLEGGSHRIVSVSVDPRGAKVDFDCYAFRGSATWEQLLSGEEEAAEGMKILLQGNNYYLHGFSDEQRWMHFKAIVPDLPECLDFYVERDGSLAHELGKAGEEAFRATVSLRSVDGSARHRQFEITAVESLGWVAKE